MTTPPQADAATSDPHVWLEEVEGEDALAWVRSQNQRTLDRLQADPRYAEFETAALSILTSKERIADGSIRDGFLYNFWQDEQAVRGLWRRVPLAAYQSTEPEWEILLDFDRLAETENANWVFKGAHVFRPLDGGSFRTLISLSDGGKDATVEREFDLESKTFVADGFVTPEAKQGTAWVDADTLLIATDWGDNTVTESGYPFVVKRWKRGQTLAEAVEVFRGEPTNVGVWPATLRQDDGSLLPMAVQADTFFTSSYWLLTDDEPVALPIPPKSTPHGITDGQLLVSLEQDWQPGDHQFLSGDVVAFGMTQWLTTGSLPPVDLVFRPSATQAVEEVAVTSEATFLSITDNVVSQVLQISRPETPGNAADTWLSERVELPGSGAVGISFADHDESLMLLRYEDFLTPTSLLSIDTATGQRATLKTLPAMFRAEGLTVEQLTATSADGTTVPYFVVRPSDAPFDGSTPTLLYGYGGFQISLGPAYYATIGRNWLERGGAYVVANIRGGGEFGPNWHQAGLKTDRQRVYDDFIAVAEGLVASGLTTPDHLGIMGGSNGGLLMGVMLNQRPDLWNAVVIQVPLLDMLRYHLLLAGASWVDEYGSPDHPEERAFLETISPYHNFDPAIDYPTPLFLTSTKDDRVHPGHARKLAKKFEEAGKDFLYYENIDGGHSAAANQTEAAKRSALEFSYLAHQLGLE